MILYYAVLPGGERLFVDPAKGKLEVVSEFKDSFSYENPGTSQEWLDDFLGQQEDFLEWAKEKTASFLPEGETQAAMGIFFGGKRSAVSRGGIRPF